MGNINSCSNTLIFNNRRNSTQKAILLNTDGNIREIKLPAKSGELMIEEIGHLITPVDELRQTRRISALGADEELAAGKVYLLVPVSRVHSKASEFEMKLAEEDHCGRRKRRSGNNNMAKVLPLPVSKLTELDGENNEVALFPVCPRLRRQRRWNPVLDPILESI